MFRKNENEVTSLEALLNQRENGHPVDQNDTHIAPRTCIGISISFIYSLLNVYLYREHIYNSTVTFFRPKTNTSTDFDNKSESSNYDLLILSIATSLSIGMVTYLFIQGKNRYYRNMTHPHHKLAR